jgi:poly(3-hydroxybutyrate) depolymerase
MSNTAIIRQLILIAVLCLTAVFAVFAVDAETPWSSAGCSDRSTVAPGKSVSRTIQVGELEREYRLHLPSGYGTGTAVPLVLAIHGYTGTAAALENERTSFSRHADEYGYVVAYPQGTGFEFAGTGITSWNDLASAANRGSATGARATTTSASSPPCWTRSRAPSVSTGTVSSRPA